VEAEAERSDVNKDDKFAQRLLRGGSWLNPPGLCRSACRNLRQPGDVHYLVGLRVVCLPQGCSFYHLNS
jgi:formylglycine-generating enzyme required for sulfatase activity